MCQTTRRTSLTGRRGSRGKSPPAGALAHRPAVMRPVPRGALAPTVTAEAHTSSPHARPAACRGGLTRQSVTVCRRHASRPVGKASETKQTSIRLSLSTHMYIYICYTIYILYCCDYKYGYCCHYSSSYQHD